MDEQEKLSHTTKVYGQLCAAVLDVLTKNNVPFNKDTCIAVPSLLVNYFAVVVSEKFGKDAVEELAQTINSVIEDELDHIADESNNPPAP